MNELSRNQQLIAELLATSGRLHAYEVKRRLHGAIGHGSVYQALSAMQAKGVVESEWSVPANPEESTGGPPRKYYQLTGLGRELLELAKARDRAVSRARGVPRTTG